MEFDQSIDWKGGYVTLKMLPIGFFYSFLADELVYQKQDKGGNCERIHT
jgi:hypothetical protein